MQQPTRNLRYEPRHTLVRRCIAYFGASIVPLAIMAGCVTIGQPFAANRVASIQLGKTKQYEIVQSFGKPFRIGEEDGDVTWTYVDYRLNVFGPQQTRDLYLRFKSDGTVK